MDHAIRRFFIATCLMALPCVLISQSQAQTSRECSTIRADEHELEYTSAALAKCASTYDPSDSCDSKFNNVKNAHDDLEDAVSDADDDCE